MSTELKLSFYLRAKEIRKDGTVPIMGRIRIGKSMAQFSAKCYVTEKIWDTKSARAIGKSKIAKELNQSLDRISVLVHTHYDNLKEKSGDVTAEQVKSLFQGIASEQESLLLFADKFLERQKLRVGINLNPHTYRRYIRSFRYVKTYLREKYNLSDISLHALNLSFINGYDHYLRIELGLKPSTIDGVITLLKSLLRRATNEGLISRNPFVGFKLKYEPLKPKSITREQLEMLMKVQLNTEQQYRVRDLFIFSAFTGIAYGDIKALTYENLVQNDDGVWWIHSKRSKTDVKFSVPMLQPALEIIERYRGTAPDNRIFKLPSSSNICINLKIISDACGFEKRINFHGARHCYASVITLSQGVPIETVSQLLGHSDMRSTRIYAQVSIEKIAKDMQALEERITGKYKLAN